MCLRLPLRTEEGMFLLLDSEGKSMFHATALAAVSPAASSVVSLSAVRANASANAGLPSASSFDVDIRRMTNEQRAYSGLLWMVENFGINETWVGPAFKEWFGCYPDALPYVSVLPPSEIIREALTARLTWFAANNPGSKSSRRCERWLRWLDEQSSDEIDRRSALEWAQFPKRMEELRALVAAERRRREGEKAAHRAARKALKKAFSPAVSHPRPQASVTNLAGYQLERA